MENHLKWLKIRNFKSIKSVDFDCKRINVFVGRPNVGKSNILEAISMLGEQNIHGKRFGEGTIRFEEVENLYFDQDLSNIISISANSYTSAIAAISSTSLASLFIRLKENLSVLNSNDSSYQTTDIGKVIDKFRAGINDPESHDVEFSTKDYAIIKNSGDFDSVNLKPDHFGKFFGRGLVVSYHFKKIEEYKPEINSILLPPHGTNLFNILKANKDLWNDVAQFFIPYGLHIILDVKNKSFEIAKVIDNLYYKLPYSLIADTLQRIIFYLAAIRSNENATLIFEEPENHSYPQYVNMLAHEMIDSETNQFFLTTHNPYLLTTLMTKGGFEDVAVYITDYKDYQTTVRQLDEKDWDDILGHRVDIFFNPDWFTKDGQFTHIH